MEVIVLLLLLLLLLLACKPTDADADTGGAAFDGQAWVLTPYRPTLPWAEVCTDADGAEIWLADCWVCLELADSGQGSVWWGRVGAGSEPWPTEGLLSLGAWTQTAEGYEVGGDPWVVTDLSTGGAWTQRAAVEIDDIHIAYQPTGTYPEGVCSQRLTQSAQ